MTTDNTPATLATVKHGGCVRLASPERARFEAWAKTHHRLGEPGYLEREQLSGDYRLQPTDYAWAAWQAALSAQPSPGGQDVVSDEMVQAACKVWAETPGQGEDWMRTALQAALAARQPVGKPVGHLYRVVVSDAGASRPWAGPGVVYTEGPAPFEGRSRNGQYLNVYAAPPAQAVDLGKFREDVNAAWKASMVGSEVDLKLGKLLALIDGQAVQS